MFWLRFAIRSCLRRRRRTGVVLAGVSVAVGALVVLGAIMVGVNDTMVANAVALRAGHVAVSGGPMPMAESIARGELWRGRARELPGVREALPRCKIPVLLKTAQRTHSAEAWLVSPTLEQAYSPVSKHMTAGAWLEGPDDTLIGDTSAAALGVSVGDSVSIVTSAAGYKRQITGIYHTGVAAYDESMLFIPIAGASAFPEPQTTFETAVFLEAAGDPAAVQTALSAQALQGEAVEVWSSMLPEVSQLILLNQFSMNLMTLIVVIILGFGVSNALLISVMDRYRHFATLIALGARPGEIVRTIVFEAVVMSLAAGLAGTLLGVAVAAAWGHVGLDLSHYTSSNPHFSVDPVVHPRVTLMMTVVPQALALSAGILSAIWPALIAARRTVSRGMRDV